MSETTEFKDVYEAIASVSPNRQNILYTVLEEDAFGEKAFFSDDKLVWESTKALSPVPALPESLSCYRPNKRPDHITPTIKEYIS